MPPNHHQPRRSLHRDGRELEYFHCLVASQAVLKLLQSKGRQSLTWPKMLKLVRMWQRQSASAVTLAPKPLPPCATRWNKALHSEKELAQDLVSSFWEGSQENNKLIFMFEDLAPGCWVGLEEAGVKGSVRAPLRVFVPLLGIFRLQTAVLQYRCWLPTSWLGHRSQTGFGSSLLHAV